MYKIKYKDEYYNIGKAFITADTQDEATKFFSDRYPKRKILEITSVEDEYPNL